MQRRKDAKDDVKEFNMIEDGNSKIVINTDLDYTEDYKLH
jgi:hypothetical protein